MAASPGVLWPSPRPPRSLPLDCPCSKPSRARAAVYFRAGPAPEAERLKLQSLTAALFLIQPVARLWGRIGHGLTPWRRHAEVPPAAVRPHVETIWSEVWRASEDWLERLESHARQFGHVSRGGDYDGWDLQFRGGVTGLAQLLLAVEEHGAGRQFLKWRVEPRFSRLTAALSLVLISLAAAAAFTHNASAAVLLAAAAIGLGAWIWRDCSVSVGSALLAIEKLKSEL